MAALPDHVDIPIPVGLLYGDLPAVVIMTGVRIWGLGWRSGYVRAGPISEEEVCRICGVRQRQLYGHLQRLVGEGVLRYTRTGRQLVFDLLETPEVEGQ